MSTEVRSRRSRGSEDVQVAQSQPIIGTPCEVPVPRNVMFKSAAVEGGGIQQDAEKRTPHVKAHGIWHM